MSPLVELEPPIVRERPSDVLVEKPLRLPSNPPVNSAPVREATDLEQVPEPFLVTRLARPKQKKTRKQPASLRPHPGTMRTAFTIVVATACVMFAGRLTRFAVEPVAATYRTGLEIRALQASMSKDAATNLRLQQDINYLKTKAGIEQEARRRGWVLPGETALSIVAPEESGAGAAGVKKKAPGTRVAISDQIRGGIDTVLAVLGGKPKAR